MIVTNGSTVTLHVDDLQRVWYLPADELPTCADMNIADAVDSGLCDAVDDVRVVACTQNIPLIIRLHERRAACRLHYQIYVCSPAFVRRCDTAGAVLMAARDISEASSLGGWHAFGPNDYPCYVLAQRAMRLRDLSMHYDRELLYGHPAWNSFSFPSLINEEALCRVVAWVRDPRWYVDLEHPDRAGGLESYMGLTPQTHARVVRGETEYATAYEQMRAQRCRAVWQAWGGDRDDHDLSDPSAFAARIQRWHADPDRGALRASQKFLKYLRYAWLHAITPRRVAGDGLFVPEHFFQPHEADAYRQHIASCRQ